MEPSSNPRSLVAPTLDVMVSNGIANKNGNNISITQAPVTPNRKNSVNYQSPFGQALPKPSIMYVNSYSGGKFYSPSNERYSSPNVAISPNPQLTQFPLISPTYHHSGGIPSHGATPMERSSLLHSLEGTPNRVDLQKIPKVDKNSKGLRHFAMKVLEKVQSKGCTTYNEVADELVREFGAKVQSPDQHSYDHKNIRRRVYDALNVLMAMKIISKEKKEIKWIGLPTNTVQELQNVKDQRNQLLQNVKAKIKFLKDLIVQEVGLKNLVRFNEEKVAQEQNETTQYRLDLPFAIITTDNRSTVDCSITPTRDEYYFNFEAPFEVFEESEIMKRLGYSNELEKGSECSKENINKCKALLPRSLYPYVEAIGCCPPNEFEEFILSHRFFLCPDNLKHLSPNTAFINHLLESCNKRKDLNLQFTNPAVTDVFMVNSAAQKKHQL